MPDSSNSPKISRLTAKKRSAVRVAIIFMSAFCISLLVIHIASIWHARSQRLADTGVAMANMSQALAVQGESALQAVDIVLAGLVESVEADGLGEQDARRLRTHVKSVMSQIEGMYGFFVMDADGRSIISSVDQPILHRYNDRGYFQYHLNHPSRATHIDKPVRSRTTGVWVLPVSRRLNYPNGDFAGIVLATIRIDYFTALYKGFDVGGAGTILLMLDDGTLIHRLPYQEEHVGADVSEGPVFRMYRASGAVGTALLRARIDNIERLYSYRHFSTYPLIIATARSKEDILAEWWETTLFQSAVVLSAILLLIVIGSRLIRQIVIRDRLESELLEARGKLQHQNRQLSLLADCDGLTQIANRRRFDQALAQEAARAARRNLPLALVMLDVDFFKRYNDTYGHVAGDACLRKVAATLQSALARPADLAARFGGEEFVALLPETDIEGARQVAERIRASVQALSIEHSGNPLGVVTISAGAYAAVPTGPGEDAAIALVSHVDTLLYKAKNSGRNQVCSGEAVVPYPSGFALESRA